MFKSVEKRIQALFSLTLVVLLGNVFLSDHAVTTVVRNQEWVNHTYDVLRSLDETLASIQEAESNQRGYLLTGLDSYLKPYNYAVGLVTRDLARLAELTSDNA